MCWGAEFVGERSALGVGDAACERMKGRRAVYDDIFLLMDVK